MEALDLKWIRGQFPALTQKINGQPAIFFDGPGGTQVPGSVLDAISDYLVRSNANAHGAFATSARTDALIIAARTAIADFLGCHSDEVVFGANMTTLTFSLSRAIGRTLQPGDEIIVTRLDHSANVSSWEALAEQGAVIRYVDVKVDDCTLDMNDLEQQINSRTKLVAVTYASNAVGTINDIAAIVKLAHAVGALVFVDAVHYAPHGTINVHALGCDFLACSAYKFFGPHVGILYGKREHLTNLQPYKVKPAPNEVPSRWETGTLNHEGLAGLVAAINYLAKLGCHVSPKINQELVSALIEADKEGLEHFQCPRFLTSPEQPSSTLASAYHSRRAALVAAMSAIQQYERELSHKLISGLLEIPGLTIYGITDPERFAWRTPTVAIRLQGKSPESIARTLGDRGIFSWHGNFYALNLTEKLGIENDGGLLRLGLVHYNSVEEIIQLLQALKEIGSAISL
ncbi:Cysteine desulfurase related protein [Trichormus variabilis ATCC 29413]|uniref:Cysteine desulfurase related protein n=2 Tax=Anabaena variabilis TaxID=264691 RepID=Q3MC38_TRIV2|nr:MULTISPECIES: cysteine desulfurase-like protein [Nostocaceae]ABA21448.1 Cysteine desulfurase related protein [Trichormus variabilis ATCC 29413]MBC1216490.1 cysteine desulfurase-like protein [Trichormus variabilis ARAD]MBC1254250.1 cysteine desulfurase-like protein [Trichormus variabilis V5]MBC1268499.1 cysteine desulfurase-like protein [Trichormus variabilis FSR]MBC1301116.1 cysteine desulfurase-like protein [Trichormus variabilis N2B]